MEICLSGKSVTSYSNKVYNITHTACTETWLYCLTDVDGHPR